VRADDTERWRVTGGATARRLDAWSEILAKTHLAFDVRATPRTPADFRAGVTRRRFGDLTLVDCVAAPFLGRRTSAVIETSGDQRRHESIVGFQFVGKGVELVREGGRELALTAGDVVLWDGLQPTEVEIIEPFSKRTLLFPRERVLAVCPRLGEQDAFPPLDRSGPARLLVRFMNALAAELPQLDPSARAAAATAALELLRGAVEPSLPANRSTTRAAMRAEIRRYVRTHLQDGALGPATIARAYSMSIRALHALFEDADESVAALVRRERLARCVEDLQQPDGGSVTEIAFRWGFSDAAHFSRLFKRAFGVTPSEVRREARSSWSGAPVHHTNGFTLAPRNGSGIEHLHADP
jgi:AraC-like DNA-binding protein